MLVKAARADEGNSAVVTDFGLAWRGARGDHSSLSMLSATDEAGANTSLSASLGRG